jgi:transcriptional regulator with XRE-family HTH domain
MGKAKQKRKGPPRVRFPLRELLARKGLSQYRCAQITGLSQQLISNLCTGKRSPSWRLLVYLLTSLGADLGDLAPKGGAA